MMVWLVAFGFILIKTITTGQWRLALNLTQGQHQALPPQLLEFKLFPIMVFKMSLDPFEPDRK